MRKILATLAMLALAIIPSTALAAPISLKLAFFASDQSTVFRSIIQPFVDAVNAEGKGLIEIIVYSGGVLGREPTQQPEIVLDGTADIAYLAPGYMPARFPGSEIIELSGLYGDDHEATLVYTRLIALNALRGYDDFVVLAAYVTGAETIHGRLPLDNVGDLKGQRIQVNNAMQGAALEYLGALPIRLEITQIADAMSDGTIDAATVSATPLFDFGIKRIATHHYRLRTGGAPLALVVNRKVFEALPQAVQDLLIKYGAESTERSIEIFDRDEAQAWQQLSADSGRTVVSPSPSDLELAHAAFQSVIADWVKSDPGNGDLLQTTERVLADLRATK